MEREIARATWKTLPLARPRGRAHDRSVLTWYMSDGTEVELGGEVRGASLFAQELRVAFENHLSDLGPDRVRIGLAPGGMAILDLNDPFLLDTFIRERGRSPARAERVTVARAPEFERPAPSPAPPFDPDVLY